MFSEKNKNPTIYHSLVNVIFYEIKKSHRLIKIHVLKFEYQHNIVHCTGKYNSRYILVHVFDINTTT